MHKYSFTNVIFVPRIYCVKVYLTRPQYEKVKEDARVKGIHMVSRYIRSIISGNSLFVEQKVLENNRILQRLEATLLKVRNK